MNRNHLFLILAVAGAVAGCGDRPGAFADNEASGTGQAPAAASKSNPSDKAEAAPDLDLVELPLDASTTEALPIAAKQSLSGEFLVPKTGEVRGVQVLVGNYSNSSVGEIGVKICQAEKCAEGKADLSKSQDNQFFYIPLTNPVAFDDGQRGSYAFTRISGDNNMAFWTYPSVNSTLKMVQPDGSSISRTLRIRLGYVK